MASLLVSSSALYMVTLGTLLASGLAYFLTRLFHARMRFISRKKLGMPVAPGHSLLFGHLLYLKTIMDALPSGAHYHYAFGEIARQHFTKEGLYYIDLWPLSGLFLITISLDVAVQTTQTSTLACKRPTLLPRFFKPIAGGSNLFDLSEKEWKPWRTVFNKGFSTDHVLSLVPNMTKITSIYCDTLRELAQKGDMFYLDPVTLRFTMDMIGKTILNTNLGAQSGHNVLADCMLSQIRWHQPTTETNPFEYLNFARWYMHWSNGRQMDDYIGKELDQRYDEYRADPANTRTKAVIDLVLQAYNPEDVKLKPEKLDPHFRLFAVRQIRLFLFVGHDSTSSTICYILHLLSQNPSALARLRTEHDKVLGKDISAAQQLLTSQPQLTKSLHYTLAVIKEALRLFTPAGCSRQGKSGVTVTDDQGNHCPTDDAVVVLVHPMIHRSSNYWRRVDEFLPERWLVEPGHELYPVKGAWRAFEYGPRNCIAQELVMTELSVVLAMIAREFDFQPAYDEWDHLHPRRGPKTYEGERAYQIEEGAAHPVDKYPCRVALREV